MSDDEVRDTLPEVTRLTARLAELEARLATTAQTRHVEDKSGATSTAIWWATQTKMTRAEAHRKTHLAPLSTPTSTPPSAPRSPPVTCCPTRPG